MDAATEGTGPQERAAPSSARTRVRRGAPHAVYDPAVIRSIIAEAPVCHVGVSTEDGPLVLPMSHGCDGVHVFLHGAMANSVLGAAMADEACLTFTLLDGFVFARSAYNNSVNYRSVVVRGRAERLEGARKVAALRRIADHVAPTWDAGRPPTDREIRRTLVVAVPLAEASAKVRTGGPTDEPEDLDGPWWSGTVALREQSGPPVASADLRAGIEVPGAILALCES